MVSAFRAKSLVKQEDSHSLIYAARAALKATGQLRIDMSGVGSIFPNGAVPWVVALRYFADQGLRVAFTGRNERVVKSHLTDPMLASSLQSDSNVLNKVWVYRTEDEGMALASAFITALEERVDFGRGTSHSLNWCLWEVMDNVFQHSHAGEGVAMVQVHYRTKHCAVAIADSGIGIHKSFRDAGVHQVADAYSAIQLAVRERVTSKTKNAGNGLYGLMRVVGAAGGELAIHSGRGRMIFRENRLWGDAETSHGVLLDLNDHHGTSVDWQFDTNRPVELTRELGNPNLSDLRMERLEDDAGNVVLLVRDFEEGLGSRKSAEMVRTRLSNMFSLGASRLTLDFEGVSLISSSFADEVLGKLALRMGVLEFMAKFELLNMTDLVKALVDRAILQRLSEGDDETPAAIR